MLRKKTGKEVTVDSVKKGEDYDAGQDPAHGSSGGFYNGQEKKGCQDHLIGIAYQPPLRDQVVGVDSDI